MSKERKNLNKWKDISFSCIGRLNIVNMTALPKSNIVSIQSLLKSQCIFFFYRNRNAAECSDGFLRNSNSLDKSSWTHISRFQNLIKSHWNQKCCTDMRVDMYTNGWSRKFWNKPLHIWSVDFQQGSGHFMWKGQAF